MNFLRGLLGAATGMATGGPGAAAVGGLGGLFSSGPHEDPVMKQQRAFQQQAANQMMGYANSVPGSSSDELANLSQSRGLLGEAQRQQQNRVMGAWSPDQGTSATGLLTNLGNTAIGQQMAQRSSFLMDAAANRRRALMDAANLGQGAASLYRPQQPQFPQVAAQLAQMLAYQQAQKRAQQQQGNGDVNMINQQGPGVFNGSTTFPAVPPPGMWSDSQVDVPGPGIAAGGGALGPLPGQLDPATAPMNPALLAALQQSGWGSPTGAQGTLTLPQSYQGVGMQGAGAPGNQMGGMNGLQNQIRQSMGLGRTIDLGGGLRLRF